MSEENKELSPDELMAQQFGDLAQEDENKEAAATEEDQGTADPDSAEGLSPDELMAQQYAQASYGESEEGKDFASHEKSENGKLSMLLDIPLEVTIEVGSTQMPIEDILKLNPNSVIELDRYINEPIDLKVNGKTIAKGELYTVKNNFGIRITHIITPEDRLKILDM